MEIYGQCRFTVDPPKESVSLTPRLEKSAVSFLSW
jgi:hypothetical protein